MSFSHREETRGDRLLDILTDDDAELRIIVSRLGAELISIARQNETGGWVGFLYRDNDISAPASGWGNHATVMGYYLHRLKNGRSFYRGHLVEGGTHSFLRAKQWRRVATGNERTRLTYEITPSDYTATEYPLNVSLELSYELTGERLRTSFLFRNEEPDVTAHVGFGLHPGFAAHTFDSSQLEIPAGLYRRHFSPDNHLSGETEDIRFLGGQMPFAREKLSGSYILELVDVPDRTFIYRDEHTRRSVVLDFTGVPYVTLWSDGGPFLCVEPCWGLTDHHEQRPFEEKEGIQRIPPNGELHASFTMSPRLATAQS